jgi:predicted nucleotidyltransferase component of viral defense system
MLNYNFISHKAKQSQIDDLTIEKEYRQLLFLQQLYLVKGSEKIFFKGGTAIRFLWQSFRFSEDLDFTSTLTKKQVAVVLKEVFGFFVKNSVSEVEFKPERVHRQLEDVSIRYRWLFKPGGKEQTVSVRIDISLREKPMSRDQSVLVPFDYPISPYPLVVHLTGVEILAEKIRALLVRSKPRDLFDLWFLLTKGILIDEKMVRRKLKLYPNIKFGKEQLVMIINKYSKRQLKQDLNQFLPQNYRNFYLSLKKETISLVNKVL